MADLENSQDTIVTEEQIENSEESTDMNFLEELPKDLLDVIAPAIYALPERIRDEDQGKYIFPQEFHNKIFRFTNKFLLFNSTSYEEISYSTVSFILRLCHLFMPDSSTMEGISEGSEHLQQIVSQALIQIEKLTQDVQNINSKLESSSSQSIQGIDDKDLENIKKDLEHIISSYKTDNDTLINKYSQQESIIKELEEKINTLENQIKNIQLPEIQTNSNDIDILNNEELINKIGTIIWNKLQNGDQDYLNVSLFNQFKEHVEKQFSILHSKASNNANLSKTKSHIDDDEGIPLSEVLKQFQVVPTHILIQLKLAGFTSEEIIQLREKGALGEWDYK